MDIENIMRSIFNADKDTLKRIAEVLSGEEERCRDNQKEIETRLLTQAEAAKRLNVSTTSIWRLIKEGRLQVVNVRGRRRVRLSSLIRYSQGEANDG